MLPKRLLEGLDRVRLRNFLVLFFLCLAVPTAVLIWQAYSQLKWESFHQYRGDAEELTQRIDARLNELIRDADARAFADYTFLVVTGDPSANFVQRSPLAAFPVDADVPGVLGYFQVASDGEFSTPLLPPDGADAASLGIDADEYRRRLGLARELQAILADNRLAQSSADSGLRRSMPSGIDAPAAVMEEEKEADTVAGLSAAVSVDEDALDRAEPRAAERQVLSDNNYSQQVFDRLNEPRKDAGFKSVGDAKRDAALPKKSEVAASETPPGAGREGTSAATPSRAKRKEQSALPEAIAAPGDRQIANVSALTDLRISTFESEIDPFEFSLLDSGHLVLFRKVWRDGERYIQGMLLDQESFMREVVGTSFMVTALADMTSLGIAYQDSVIQTFDGRDSSRRSYPNVAEGLDGTLLYRNRLTAPLDRLELIFSIKRLPPGPGASVLAWLTLVLAIVLVGGFMTLYRTGLRQIALARQQQDFVSAVSHELKSPLTSIRMYGEMLKEGWADEGKRQSYYEYIHDEAERLSRLIANVLQLAQITRNEPQSRYEADQGRSTDERYRKQDLEPDRARRLRAQAHDGRGRGPGGDQRRPGLFRPDDHQPGGQRHQVFQKRRDEDYRDQLHTLCRQRHPVLRPGLRPGYSQRPDEKDLSAFLPLRVRTDPRNGGHRYRPGNRASARDGDGWSRRHRQRRARGGIQVLVFDRRRELKTRIHPNLRAQHSLDFGAVSKLVGRHRVHNLRARRRRDTHHGKKSGAVPELRRTLHSRY